ncbi:MAG TPA: nuclear transport factor 2 family protein [Mycobacterium sp.]|nr:nuclear transport factor 2 family protein [Mycobacterium sp.]
MANHEEICRAWARAWGHASPQDFAAQYTEDGVYVDHAFRIARSGREAIEEHSAIWHNSISNFEMTPREIWATPDGAFMTWVGTGHFARNLAAMAATGADFVCHGAIWLKIDATGKITESEEYYSTTFGQKGGVESYPLIPAGQAVTPATDG